MRLLLMTTVALLLGVMPGGKKTDPNLLACCHARAHAMYEACMLNGGTGHFCYSNFMQSYQTCIKSGGAGTECAQ